MVKFKEAGHKYFTLDDKELTSVSGLMKKFEPKVNWTEKAKQKSKNLLKYEGISMTYQEILDKWEKARVKGTEAGTLVHKAKEDELLAKKGIITIKESEFDGNYKYALNVNQLEDNTVYPELMIYDLEHGLCGQSDEVEIKNGVIEVRDHKTDKEIKTRGYSSRWEPAQTYLKPLDHLEVCNYNTYSIKMSLYMYLIWKANKGKFKPGKILLNWCPIERDEDGLPILYSTQTGEVVEKGGIPNILEETIIEVPYLKKEVMAMLKTIKK